MQIPLVIRAHEGGHAVYGVALETGRAWLTDITFLKDDRARTEVRPAFGHPYEARLDVTVFYGHGQRSEASFNLEVPRFESGARMTVYQVA